MLRRDILKYVAGRLRPEAKPRHGFRREEVAAAALLVQCARVDAAFTEGERAVICEAVRDYFGLDDETTGALVEVATRCTAEVWDDWLFLDAVKRGFSPEQRIGILERLWQVAQADGRMHPFEERLISRVASELGISEADMEKARAQASARAGAPERKPAG